MSDNERTGPSPEPPPELAPLRPLTRQLVEAIALDMWPGNAAVVDFGLDSQEHYEALYYPVRNGEITPSQLEGALGKGPKLTELANGAPSNPHKGIVFRTGWDGMHASLAREVFDAAVEAAYVRASPEQLGGLTLPAPAEGTAREAFEKSMEERHWGEWEKESWGHDIRQLHEMAEDYHGRLEGLARQGLNEGPDRAAEKAAAANYEAMLRDYREGASIQYEEKDGSHRTWPELSPEGKLGYLARDAACAGAAEGHFAAAVGELLGEVPRPALNLVLEQARELHAIARLMPDHPSYDQLPLVERVKDVIAERGPSAGPAPGPGSLREEIAYDEALRREMWERGEKVDRPTSPRSVLGYGLAEPAPAPEQDRTRGR